MCECHGAPFSAAQIPDAVLYSRPPSRRPRTQLVFGFSISVHGKVRPFASLTSATCRRPQPFSLSREAPYSPCAVEVISELADAAAGSPADSQAEAVSSAGPSTSTSASHPQSSTTPLSTSTTALDPTAPGATAATPSSAASDGTSTSTSTTNNSSQSAAPTPRFPAAARTRQAAAAAAASSSSKAEAPVRVAPSLQQQQQPQKAEEVAVGDAAEEGGQGSGSNSEAEEAAAGVVAGSQDREEAATATEERELAAMPVRCWCAACKKAIPQDALAARRGVLTCSGCHRCYHAGCASSGGLGTGWAARLPAWALQLPPFAGRPWFHCNHCQQVSEALGQFADAGEVEMPGIRDAMLDAETDEEVPYYTLRLFRAQQRPALAEDVGFRQLVGVLRRHAPLYVPLVTPLDCLEFDYGLLVWRDAKPVAAAMFDVFGREVAASPLYGARDVEARECLVEVWAELLRDCGLKRVGLQLPDDDYAQKALWERGHGFQEMDRGLLDSLAKEIPAYAEELQVGNSYLVRDLFSSPEILRSPEDVRARYVELDVNEEVMDKVGQRDVGMPRQRRP